MKMKKHLYAASAAMALSGFLSLGAALKAEAEFRMETSPDGMMWTITEELPEQTRPDGTPAFWYDADGVYNTGFTSSIRALEEGEHYYRYNRTGTIPVGQWKAEWKNAVCQSSPIQAGSIGHGITSGHWTGCFLPYFSGWTAYCADCGEPVLPGYVYMSAEAVKSLNTLNVDRGYYFLCPCRRPLYKQVEFEEVEGMDIKRPVIFEVIGYEDCRHLNQYFEGTPHVCKTISYNRYKVVYDSNTTVDAGSMESSFHMYNNADMFEGKAVTPQKTLSNCTFDRTAEGYVFAGWNTERDGTGTWYADGEEIYNLSIKNFNVTSENYELDKGIVYLYAQWKRVESTLLIDAAGGFYQGTASETRTWDTHLSLDPDLLIPPAGHTVSFRTDGGTLENESITGTMSFLSWELMEPANGRLSGNTYIYRGADQTTDTVRASYKPDPVVLPLPEKEGSSFGGWYYDSACTRLAGYSGEPHIFTEDMVLYAEWVDLKLTAVPDYEADGGRGAAGLSWSQQDGLNKSYRIFRRREDQEEFEQVLLSSDEESAASMKHEYGYDKEERKLTIPSNGFYTLTAEGAQGGNYGDCIGGPGGSVSGSFYLEKGEVISFAAGGQDGTGGGGAGSDYAPGGGYTLISSDRKGDLLAAGGGGGATASRNGLPGGSSGHLAESGMDGQDGMAGGGGGRLGGTAGSREIHVHSKEAGCYKDASFEALSSDKTEKTEGRWTDHEEDEEGNDLKDEAHFFQQIGSPENLIPVNGNTTMDVGAWIHVKAHNCLDPRSFVEVRDQNGSVIASFTYGELLKEWEDRYKFYGTEAGMNAYFDGAPSVAWVDIFDDWSKSSTGGGEFDVLEGYDVRWTNFYENGAVQMSGVRLDPHYGSPVYMGDYPEKNYPKEYFFHEALTRRGFADRPLIFSYRSAWYGYTGVHFRHTVSLPEGTEGVYLRAEGILDTITLHESGYENEKGEWVDTSRWMATGYEEPTAGFDKIYLSGGSVLACRKKNIDIPAGGGSSWANPDYALSCEEKEGVRSGDGAASIQAELAGLVQAEGLDHAAAPDLAPPYAVDEGTVTMESAGEGTALIRFGPVEDQGTRYYFKAESYSALTGSRVCDSNTAECLIKTGVKGYYYVIDADSGKDSSEIAASGSFLPPDDRIISVPIGEEVQYLHIAAADNAGNISEALHLKLDGSTARIPWEVSTENMDISSTVGGTDYGNVYPAAGERIYYVRADGSTPFLLSFHSFMHGAARTDYQIDEQIFDFRTDSASQRHGTKLPHTAPLSSTDVLDASAFSRWSSGSSLLSDASFTGAERSGYACSVDHFRAFVMPPSMNGTAVTAVPVAGASFEDSVKYSEWEEDMTHYVRLIGDGEGPETDGLDALPEGTLINREDGPLVLELSAEDALSGVKEFYVTVKNADNGASQRYEPDEDGIIRIDATAEDPVFSGDFTVEVHAADNVGNETVISRSATECSLAAEVYRMLPPHGPAFKRGESGVLEVRTWGYVDRVEIEFPDFLSGYSRTYDYAVPEHRTEEAIQFMIPLALPVSEDGGYEIKVKAYKDGREMEAVPSITVHGTVLDDIRTRLR